MTDDRAARRRRERADRKGQWAKEQDEFEIERAWELDPSWKAYVTHIRTDVAPAMFGSKLSIALVPDRPEDVDVKLAVEIGLAVLFDKPLIFCVPEGAVIPEHLRRLGTVIEGAPTDPVARELLIDAIREVKGD